MDSIHDVVVEVLHGFFDSFKGLKLLTELDRDEEIEAVNILAATPPTTVLGRMVFPRVVCCLWGNGTLVGISTDNFIKHAVCGVIAHLPLSFQLMILWLLQCAGLNLAIIIVLKALSVIFAHIVGLIFSDTSWSDNASGFLVVPVFLITRVIMVLWFSDIAAACLRALGRTNVNVGDWRARPADLVVSVVLGTVFLIQSILPVYLSFHDGITRGIFFVHMSLLNALYSFEYYWSSQGIMLDNRIRLMETRWAYFFGFGAPLTFLTTYTQSFVVDGCMFGMLFPFFIISSYKAELSRRELPRIPIFYPSHVITNKLVVFFSERVIATQFNT